MNLIFTKSILLPFMLISFFFLSYFLFFSHLLCELAVFHVNNCHFYWNTRCVFSVIHHLQMRDAALKSCTGFNALYIGIFQKIEDFEGMVLIMCRVILYWGNTLS